MLQHGVNTHCFSTRADALFLPPLRLSEGSGARGWDFGLGRRLDLLPRNLELRLVLRRGSIQDGLRVSRDPEQLPKRQRLLQHRRGELGEGLGLRRPEGAPEVRLRLDTNRSGRGPDQNRGRCLI